MTRYIVGDIHGDIESLNRLLTLLNLSNLDELYLLGDMIDRGTSSAEVVDLVRKNNYKPILGNHELYLIRAYKDIYFKRFYKQIGGKSTINSYKSMYADTWKTALKDDIKWLLTLPLCRDLGDIFLIHAGVNPKKLLHQQTEEDLTSIRGKFHYSPARYFNDKTIIVGHTITHTFPHVSAGELAAGNGWIGIDTSTYSDKSGWLTALDYDNKLVYQVNVRKNIDRIVELEKVSVNVNG